MYIWLNTTEKMKEPKRRRYECNYHCSGASFSLPGRKRKRGKSFCKIALIFRDASMLIFCLRPCILYCFAKPVHTTLNAIQNIFATHTLNQIKYIS